LTIRVSFIQDEQQLLYFVHSVCNAVNQSNSCEQSPESDIGALAIGWELLLVHRPQHVHQKLLSLSSVPLSFFSKSSALVTCVHFQHISSSPCSSFYFHVSRAPLKNFFHAKVHLLLGIKRRKELASSFLDQTRASGAGFLSASLLLFLSLSLSRSSSSGGGGGDGRVVDCRYLCSPISCHLLFLTTVTAAKFFKNAVRKKVNWIFLVSFAR
jgi:hypothetical protein